MNSEGPVLESLLRRLSECPGEFIDTCKGECGGRQVAAIIADHFRGLGESCPAIDEWMFLRRLQVAEDSSAASSRWFGLLAVGAWLLHDTWFMRRPDLAVPAMRWLDGAALKQMSEIVSPIQCVTDPDRREELIRNCLAALGLRPYGESLEQAQDRCTTLDSVERLRILRATADAERRSREVREAMARKQALESASRYGE